MMHTFRRRPTDVKQTVTLESYWQINFTKRKQNVLFQRFKSACKLCTFCSTEQLLNFHQQYTQKYFCIPADFFFESTVILSLFQCDNIHTLQTNRISMCV